MAYRWLRTLERCADRLTVEPGDDNALQLLCGLADLIAEHGFDIDLWHTQNACYQLKNQVRPQRQRDAAQGDADSQQWLQHFDRLCRAGRIAVPG